VADAQSFLSAIYLAIDIYNSRTGNAKLKENPLKPADASSLAGDENDKIE